jgi:hypothetical protein
MTSLLCLLCLLCLVCLAALPLPMANRGGYWRVMVWIGVPNSSCCCSFYFLATPHFPGCNSSLLMLYRSDEVLHSQRK